MANHNTLTGAELHEPKDVSTAVIGTNYVADGAGSGAWDFTLPPNQIIPVTEADLGTDEGTYIQLKDNTEFIITGIAASPFIITKELRLGTNSVLTGLAPELSVLKYTGSGVAIRCSDQSLRMRNIKLVCNNNTTGTGLVVDNSGFTTLSLVDNCVFSTMNQIADITTGAGASIIRSFAGMDTTIGVIASGTNTGTLTIFDAQFLSIASDHIDLGTSVHGDVIFRSILSVPSSGKGLLKALNSSANITNRAKMFDCTVNDAAGGSTLTTITTEALKWTFLDNSLIKNSAWVGNVDKDTGRTITTLITSTAVKIAGTSTLSTETERFDDDSGIDNRLKSLDNPPFKALATGNITGQSNGGSSITCDIEIHKNGSFLVSVFHDVDFPTGSDSGFTFHKPIDIVTDDYFEVFIKRTAGSQDFDCAHYDFTIVRVG